MVDDIIIDIKRAVVEHLRKYQADIDTHCVNYVGEDGISGYIMINHFHMVNFLSDSLLIISSFPVVNSESIEYSDPEIFIKLTKVVFYG